MTDPRVARAATRRSLAARLYALADLADPGVVSEPARFFSSNSIWNVPKSYRPASAALLPDSPNTGWVPLIASNSGSAGIFLAGPNDLRMILNTVDGRIGNSTTGYVAPGPILGPRWPVDVIAAPGGDKAACLVDGDTLTDAYGLAWDGSSWSAKTLATCSLSGSGFGTPAVPRIGVRAAGTSFGAGLMRTSEIVAGRIEHMLAMAVGLHVIRRGPVAPVYAEDDEKSVYSGSWCRMGSIAMIDPAMSLAPFTDSLLRMVVVALQTYGVMVVDTCDYTPFVIYGQQGSDFDRNYSSGEDSRRQMLLIQRALRIITYPL